MHSPTLLSVTSLDQRMPLLLFQFEYSPYSDLFHHYIPLQSSRFIIANLLNEDGILFTSVPLLGQPLYLEGLILPSQGNTDASRSAQTFSPPGVRNSLLGSCWTLSMFISWHLSHCPGLTFCCPQWAVNSICISLIHIYSILSTEF